MCSLTTECVLLSEAGAVGDVTASGFRLARDFDHVPAAQAKVLGHRIHDRYARQLVVRHLVALQQRLLQNA